LTAPRQTITLRASTLLLYATVVVAVVALWFTPSLLHVRGEYRPYDETATVPAQGHIERRFELYRPWETDLVLTGKFLVDGGDVARLYVMDWENYNNWRSGGSYRAEYASGFRSALEFRVPIPPADHAVVEYYLVFENPSSRAIAVVYDAGILFERAYLGYAYTAWLSRLAIVALVAAVALRLLGRRYRVRVDFGGIMLGGFTVLVVYLLVSRWLFTRNLWVYPF
jgi:hypothetical protein